MRFDVRIMEILMDDKIMSIYSNSGTGNGTDGSQMTLFGF